MRTIRSRMKSPCLWLATIACLGLLLAPTLSAAKDPQTGGVPGLQQQIDDLLSGELNFTTEPTHKLFTGC